MVAWNKIWYSERKEVEMEIFVVSIVGMILAYGAYWEMMRRQG